MEVELAQVFEAIAGDELRPRAVCAATGDPTALLAVDAAEHARSALEAHAPVPLAARGATGESAGSAEPLHRAGHRPGLAVPVSSGDDDFGAVAVYSRRRAPSTVRTGTSFRRSRTCSPPPRRAAGWTIACATRPCTTRSPASPTARSATTASCQAGGPRAALGRRHRRRPYVDLDDFKSGERRSTVTLPATPCWPRSGHVCSRTP